MVQRHHGSKLKPAAVALLAIGVAGCAAMQTGGAPGPREPDGPSATQTMSAAGESLLMQGRAERSAGDLAQASMTLERALRIEPQQAMLWLELARVRLDEGNFAQAEQLARKAQSLVGPDDPLGDSIRMAIDEARRRQAAPL